MGIFIASFKVTGVSPLLQNNASSISDPKDTSKAENKKVYTPEGDAAKAAYKNEDGTFYISTDAFRKAMITACSGRKIGKIAANKLFRSAIFPVEERLTILDPENMKPVKKYEIDTRGVVVMKARVPRSRPIFRKWCVLIDFEVDDEQLQTSHIEQILNIAGKVVGVGDFRVEKNGKFGRFAAEQLQNTVKKAKAA
jgi:hypothetical protein